MTTVAPQSLNLLNDDLVIRAATALAERVRAEVGDDSGAWPAAAVRIVLQRGIEPEEEAAAADLLRRHAALHDGAPVRALVDLCRALLNVNEFLHID